MPSMELKVKLAKSKNIYLQNNKQKTKVPPNMFPSKKKSAIDVLKTKEYHEKINVTFLALIKKETRCVWCI